MLNSLAFEKNFLNVIFIKIMKLEFQVDSSTTINIDEVSSCKGTILKSNDERIPNKKVHFQATSKKNPSFKKLSREQKRWRNDG